MILFQKHLSVCVHACEGSVHRGRRRHSIPGTEVAVFVSCLIQELGTLCGAIALLYLGAVNCSAMSPVLIMLFEFSFLNDVRRFSLQLLL